MQNPRGDMTPDVDNSDATGQPRMVLVRLLLCSHCLAEFTTKPVTVVWPYSTTMQRPYNPLETLNPAAAIGVTNHKGP